MAQKISMNLNFEEFKDRVYACWLGKNIGGTMGTPYEGVRSTLDIKGFSTAPGTPLPNDDLDLQLVWLYAVEKLGANSINAQVLGEMWINTIVPNWNEYGIGKNNVRRGLLPPISGDYNNSWKNSNGAWIRTEIWACLAPGCPEIASKYAMEDAKVDHGTGEGTTAAAFVAAMQSAAFVVRDIRRCIELGLASIPEKSRMADSVRLILECYDKGMSALETRNAVFERNSDIGDGWFEAPSNVSYAIIGLLYGNGDFKKAMITAINCGDDTDCTGATVGATMGILGGMKEVPADWREYIGDEIVTISLNKAYHTVGNSFPKTCKQLTDRVVAQAPVVLLANAAPLTITDRPEELPENTADYLLEQCNKLREVTVMEPFSAHFDSPLMSVDMIMDGSPDIEAGDEREIKILIRRSRIFGDDPMNINCRWWLPEGFTLVKGRQTSTVPGRNAHSDGSVLLKYVIRAGEGVEAVNRCVLEIAPQGRAIPVYVPVVYLG